MEILKIKTPDFSSRFLPISAITLILVLAALPAQSANFLWTGGEDIDFPNGGAVCAASTAGQFRAGYARQTINPCSGALMAKSSVFRGGGVTSAWLSARIYSYANGSTKYIGLGKNGTNSGLFVGIGTTYISLWKLSSGTWTKLSESTTSHASYQLYKYDMQIINYGASGTVKIYISGQNGLNINSPVLNYSGDISIAGMPDMDMIFMPESFLTQISEIIVSDSDTRSLSLVTLSPNAAGDTNDWTGAHTDVNTTLQNDGSPITNNTSGNVFQANLSEMPSTNLAVLNVKIAARGTTSAGGMTSISVGVKTNGSAHEPAAVTQTGAWNANETYYNTNPVTSANWTASEMSPLQINLKTAP